MIRLGYCAHGLKGLDLGQAVTLSAQCGFSILDLDATPGSSQIAQSELAASSKSTGRQVRRLAAQHGVELHELFLVFVAVDGRAIPPDTPEAGPVDAMIERFKPICEGAREAGFASIMLGPGHNEAGLPPSEAIERAAQRLNRMIDIADAAEIRLNVEPSFNSIVNSLERVAALRKLVPKLSLTLDYAHFTGNGVLLDSVYPLHEIAGHIHFKPATYGEFKAPYRRNEIDFGAIIRRLNHDGWQGVISAETIYPVGARDSDQNPIVQGILVLEEARAALAEVQP